MTDLTKPFITYCPEIDPVAPWRVWLPPTGPECFTDGDTENGDLLDSWGDTFWPTVTSAADLIAELFVPSKVDDTLTRDYPLDDEGTLNVHVQLTDEGVIVDLYDSHGNCLDTWARAANEFFEDQT